jgi:hypothetical protein
MDGISDKFLPPQTSVDRNTQESKYGTNKKDGIEDGDLRRCLSACQSVSLLRIGLLYGSHQKVRRSSVALRFR